jgi:hypothetical protein
MLPSMHKDVDINPRTFSEDSENRKKEEYLVEGVRMKN